MKQNLMSTKLKRNFLQETNFRKGKSKNMLKWEILKSKK